MNVELGVELGEFDLHFTPRTTMNGQALVDFTVECSIPLTSEDNTNSKNEEDHHLWIVYIDRSSNEHGSGADVMLESPDGSSLKHSIRCGFKASNKVMEYKAALVGMDLDKIIKVRKILMKFDSQLVVGQSIENLTIELDR